MRRLVLIASLLAAVPALAGDLEVPLNGRAPIKAGRRTIHEVLVRDPSMLQVVITDGAISLEGKQHGVTGVTVKYSDGELERILVVVGNETPTKGPRMERAQAVDVKPNETATAKAPDQKQLDKEKKRAAVQDASDAVRAAVEAL